MNGNHIKAGQRVKIEVALYHKKDGTWTTEYSWQTRNDIKDTYTGAYAKIITPKHSKEDKKYGKCEYLHEVEIETALLYRWDYATRSRVLDKELNVSSHPKILVGSKYIKHLIDSNNKKIMKAADYKKQEKEVQKQIAIADRKAQQENLVNILTVLGADAWMTRGKKGYGSAHKTKDIVCLDFDTVESLSNLLQETAENYMSKMFNVEIDLGTKSIADQIEEMLGQDEES